PAVKRGIAVAQRIKGTPGITGLSRPIVHIDGAVWHLDVGSSHPGAGAGPKGPAVRRLKRYVSWVQNVNYIAFYYCKVVRYRCTSHPRYQYSTNIGETRLGFIERSEGQYRGKTKSSLSNEEKAYIAG